MSEYLGQAIFNDNRVSIISLMKMVCSHYIHIAFFFFEKLKNEKLMILYHTACPLWIVSAVMSGIGMASGDRVKRSIHVRR